MSEYKLIGHETYLEKFVTLYENNELPNKILLSGKKGCLLYTSDAADES